MYNIVIFTDNTSNIASIPAIGAYKCAHSLRKAGFSCLVVDNISYFSRQELKDLISQSISHHTFLVGFSNTFLLNTQVVRDKSKPTPQFTEITNDVVFPQGKDFENDIFEELRAVNPSIKFVVGGHRTHPNISNKNFDYACLGYSEMSIVKIANFIAHGTEEPRYSKNIFGVKVIDDRFAEGYNFSCEDMVWEPTDVVNHKCLPIEIGRGCVFRCKFCAFPLNGKKTLDFVKQADILKHELQSNYDRYGITTYQIVDDTFNDHIQKLDMIADVVKNLSFTPKFWAYTRLDLLHTRPNTIETLFNIGLRSFFFGIETLHPNAGRAIGKGYDFNKAIETINLIHNRYPEISMHGSFIVGLPHEDVEHVTATFNKLISQEIPLDSWKFYPLMIEEPSLTSFNSDISLNYEKYGYKKIGNVTPRVINWENEYMNWDTAVKLVDDFTTQSRAHEEFKIEGSLAFPLSSMGLNLSSLMKTSWKDFDFHHVEYYTRINFINEYKAKLLKLVKEANSITSLADK